MRPFFLVDRSNAKNTLHARNCIAGEGIYQADTDGLAWWLKHGVIRLDNARAQPERSFVAADISAFPSPA